MRPLPRPDLEPQPIAYRDFLELAPKFEWMDGYLFDPPYSHQERRRLLAILLVNEGLIRTVQLASGERWLEALKQVYGGDKSGRYVTCEEFLDRASEDILVSKRHRDIADFLISVMRTFVEQRDLGIVLSAPFQMKLEQGREPDLLFVAKEHLTRLQETCLDGPADLVVEIVSPEGAGRDRNRFASLSYARGEKFYEYEAGGVTEYWLIDPQKERAEFYQLRDGQYQQVAPDAEGIYCPAVLPGFWLRVEWLWQEPLPRTLDVLRELGVL